MQFIMWPNYGVVENVEQLANFVRGVYLYKEARKGEGIPIVIHCSGGVGRSGNFTTIFSMLVVCSPTWLGATSSCVTHTFPLASRVGSV